MVHSYKNNGYNIVLDVDSGSVHVVDEVTYDIIEMFQEKSFEEIEAALKDKYSVEDIKESYDEVAALKDAEMLFTEDIYEQYITDYPRGKNTIEIKKRAEEIKLCNKAKQINTIPAYEEYLTKKNSSKLN